MVKKLREEVFKHRPKMSAGKKIVLGLPVVLSLIWILYLQVSPQIYYGQELLAPADTTPLMIALIIFTVGYIIFLLMMFSENIQNFFARVWKH